MRYYELTCLISPNLSEEELKLFQEKIRNFIQEEDGVLIEAKNPVKRNLGYSIKNRFQPKTKTVYVATLNFNLATRALAKAKRTSFSSSSSLPFHGSSMGEDEATASSVAEKLENLEKKLKSENQIIRYLILGREVQKVIKSVLVDELRSSSRTSSLERVRKNFNSFDFANARVPKIPLVPTPKVEKTKKEKVKLKEIEEKLEEILGES